MVKLNAKVDEKLSEEEKLINNQFKLDSFDVFNLGKLDNIEVTNEIANGAIVLGTNNGEYFSKGVYLSEEISVTKFDDLVVSWNSDTPEGTYIEVEARILVNHYDKEENMIQTWTDYFSWGKWSPHKARRSTEKRSDNLARMSVDTLSVNGSKGEVATKVQLRVNLYTDDSSKTPAVRYLHGSIKNSNQEIEKVFANPVDIRGLDKDIETPKYSQLIRNPSSARSICSPTVITMMLNRLGDDLLPDEVAQKTYDNNYGFGNWSFALATAGSYGYKSHVDFSTVEGLKQEIAKGYPVGVSVTYTNDPEESRPYIEGSPGSTPGHLIVVRGFTTRDNIEYVIVNDSYAPEDETVRREYKLNQFDKAWKNRVAYIIRDKEVNTGKDHSVRIQSTLEATDIAGEYQVFSNGKNIDVTNFGGVIAYTIDDDATHNYFARADKNSLTFTDEETSNINLKVYIMTDLGKVYLAKRQ